MAGLAGLALLHPAAGRADQCLLLCPTAPPTTVPPATTPPTTAPSATVPPVTQPAPAPSAGAHPSPGVDSAGAAQLLDLVNQVRAEAGLGTLVTRDDIVSIAVGHSQDMANQSLLFHNDNLFSPAVRASLGAGALGENVDMNFNIPAVHAAFMNSPHHLANIVDPRFTAAGFGVVIDAAGDYWVTEDFAQIKGIAAPRSAPRPPAARAATSPAGPPRARVAAVAPTASTTTPTDPPPATTVVASPPASILALAPPEDRAMVPLHRANRVGALFPGLAVMALVAVAGAGLVLPGRMTPDSLNPTA
jgi:uncharacterized protein YkwD